MQSNLNYLLRQKKEILSPGLPCSGKSLAVFFFLLVSLLVGTTAWRNQMAWMPKAISWPPIRGSEDQWEISADQRRWPLVTFESLTYHSCTKIPSAKWRSPPFCVYAIYGEACSWIAPTTWNSTLYMPAYLPLHSTPWNSHTSHRLGRSAFRSWPPLLWPLNKTWLPF